MLPTDLVLVDTGDFGACCEELPGQLSPERVVVIGPEPDPAYRQAALARGAGGWLCRDNVGEKLSAALHDALGCTHAVSTPVVREEMPSL